MISPPVPGQVRRARTAVMVAFAVNGAMPATLLARYAEVKESLSLTTGTFGLVIATLTVGAALTFHVPGFLVRRFGTRTITTIGTVSTSLSLTLAGVAVLTGQVWLLSLALLLAGYSDGTVDVAQNAQGLRVQEALGRSALTSMHAGWSVGAAIGGAVGTIAASLGVPIVLHLAIWAITCSAVMTIAGSRFLRAGTVAAEDEAPRRVPRSAWHFLVPVSLVAIAGITVEDIGNNWSAVLLNTERGVDASQAGIALTVLLTAQFLGRMLGDRIIDRVGMRATLIASLVGIVIGLNVVAWAPNTPLTLVGFALAGLACAVTVPIAFTQADTIPGLRAHTGLALLAWILRAATVALTPSIGLISIVTSLPIAITLISLVGVAAIAAQARGDRPGSATER